MVTVVVFDRIRGLDPRQFENLAYQSLRALGMRNLTWRTPGADGGRDIEGLTTARDLAGFEESVRWFVECKHYSSSISWPTVWAKLSYAESNDADVLLFVTTNNPSPKCESEITSWNRSRRRPLVRFWRGYELANIMRGIPHVAAMFGLLESKAEAEVALMPLAALVSKLCQNAYTRTYFNSNDVLAVEASAAASELFADRLRQIKEYGRPVPGLRADRGVGYEWLTLAGDFSSWEELALRAVTSLLRNEFHAASATLALENDAGVFELVDPKFVSPMSTQNAEIETLSFWAKLEVTRIADRRYQLKELPYE